MLPLLPLLGELRHLFDRHILTFETIKFQMNFIDKVKDPGITVGNIKERIQSIILDHLQRIRQTRYLNISHKLTSRIPIYDLPAILHRRKRLTTPLRTAKNHQPFRIKILRMSRTKFRLIPSTTKQADRTLRAFQ